MARIKPEPVIVGDRAEAERTLGEIAALEREITAIETEMQARIDAAKEEASQRAKGMRERHKTLSEAVGAWATLNKADLFQKAKSLDLGFGIIGFRASTKITQARGIAMEMTLEKMRQYNLADGIRLKEEINKEACLGWPEERLELVGLKRSQADRFFIEIRKDELPAGV